MNQLLISIQKFLLQNKRLILNVFLAAELSLLLLLPLGWLVLVTDPDSFLVIYNIGKKFGVVGLSFYTLTLIPGMLKRFRILPLVGAILHTFRRQFGVMMFLSAIVHSCLVLIFQDLSLGGLPRIWGTPAVWGLLALLTLFPLWLTSNDLSQKNLGPNWKKLHRLTYIALFFIFFHVYFFRSQWVSLAGLVLVLQAASWIVYWFRPKAQPAVASQPSTTASPPSSQPLNQ